MPDVATVRAFCGLSADAEPTVLNMCLKAAVKWYADAGVPAPAALTETSTPEETAYMDGYDFWTCNLAAYLYDNRGAGGADTVIPPYILASLHQLRPIPATGEATT